MSSKTPNAIVSSRHSMRNPDAPHEGVVTFPKGPIRTSDYPAWAVAKSEKLGHLKPLEVPAELAEEPKPVKQKTARKKAKPVADVQATAKGSGGVEPPAEVETDPTATEVESADAIAAKIAAELGAK